MGIKTCCVTGNRYIEEKKVKTTRNEITLAVMSAIFKDCKKFISGFSYGVDLIFADVVLELKQKYTDISLHAEIPYRKRLFTSDEKFQKLIEQCSSIYITSENYYKGCFGKRNKEMIEKSDLLIAVYDKSAKDSTKFNINYAKKLNKEINVIKM